MKLGSNFSGSVNRKLPSDSMRPGSGWLGVIAPSSIITRQLDVCAANQCDEPRSITKCRRMNVRSRLSGTLGKKRFEADECVSMNEWLAACPHADLMHGAVGSGVSIGDMAGLPSLIEELAAPLPCAGGVPDFYGLHAGLLVEDHGPRRRPSAPDRRGPGSRSILYHNLSASPSPRRSRPMTWSCLSFPGQDTRADAVPIAIGTTCLPCMSNPEVDPESATKIPTN
jgi:hypothetical protein